MPTINANGIDICYTIEGEGPETVVLVIGLGDQKEGWDFQAADLVGLGYRVLRMDNRGIGGTSKPEGPYSIKLMASDVKALTESLGIAEFHLVGYSMGGMIAIEYALAHPDDLKSLTLASTFAEPELFAKLMFSNWKTITETSGWQAALENVLLWCFSTEFYETNTAFAQEIFDGIGAVELTDASFLGQLDAILSFSAADRVAGIGTRTLVLGNKADALIPAPYSKRLHEALPNASWHMPEGGHASLWEYPEAYTRVLAEFFAG